MSEPDIAAVRQTLMQFQDRVCAAIEQVDGAARFDARELPGPDGALSRPRVLEGGERIEKAGVNFTHARGNQLPPTATERRPELAGRGFQAVSTSLIVHPRNPYAPTTHANLRFFVAEAEGESDVWWFGGGLDLTPTYGYAEDAVHWHRCARAACGPDGDALYLELKDACDRYFFLPHRGETRGIGGLFFDDFDRGGFDTSFALVQAVADQFLPAYLPILERRIDTPYGERERDFQLYRRGRYVEFNLLYDRGTRYGLQSGRRIESVLVSMPPVAHWRYDHQAEPGSPEAELAASFLKPRDWLSDVDA